MDILRTPDERFTALADFPWQPQHLDVDASDGSGPIRMAYLDEGPADGRVVLMLHGEPSWSYLYRTIIPPVLADGHRVVAPDLIGFGRSDKPAAVEDHTYARHVGWVTSLLDQLGLREITLLCQDWGGLIGLRIAGTQPERFAGIVAANTWLPEGDGAPTDAFLAWRDHSQRVDELRASRVLQGATARELSPEELVAYDAPFPDQSYAAGARAFPILVPIGPDDPGAAENRAAWEQLARFPRPFLTAHSDGDPVTAGTDIGLQERIDGAAGQPHTTLCGGHFLQEDAGPQLAKVVCDMVARYP